MWARKAALALACLAGTTAVQAAAPDIERGRDPIGCAPFVSADGQPRRVVCADVAALDHMLVYNRFGSFNPFGMIFALRRDLSSSETNADLITADECDTVTGSEEGKGPLEAGKVRLKDCKRARPLVLRANVGDVLHLRVTNFLAPFGPDFSRDFCRGTLAASEAKRAIRAAVSEGTADEAAVGEVACGSGSRKDEGARGPSLDWPSTRGLSVAIQGMTAIAGPGGTRDEACLGLRSFAPGEIVNCFFEIDREGTYFLSSKAAPAGGEGDGGSITHGLFGAVVVEQKATAWYRSQVSRRALDAAWKRSGEGCEPDGALPRHARLCRLDYDRGHASAAPGIPELRMTKERQPGAEEVVHADLNAIVYRPAGLPDPDRPGATLGEVKFREFSVFFHDELKTFFTKNFEELARFGQLAGVRDGFAINYGSSGMGTMLLANRKKIGPANDCAECLYEEFFLQSWANGDPALLEQFPDDPSNVHHSYLNDRIVFRNFHAGPKETHVFHLHAHQWFAGNDPNRGSYLDSQTVSPQQGFTYNIYGGGLKGGEETLGSGNRNRTVGDSIFHCHLYPHFAQGMWELWRVHDVLEDGTRKLPDGEKEPGLSLTERAPGDVARRSGSFDPATGGFLSVSGRLDEDGKVLPSSADGTPIPAIVPLPDAPLPPIPTYSADGKALEAMPGYPFYIAGKPGHRAPQAPLDLAQDTSGNGEFLDGGLPRHVLKDRAERKLDIADTPVGAQGSEERRASSAQILAKMLALGNFAGHLEKADLELLPYDGTDAEKAAMAFHHDGAGVSVRDVSGKAVSFDAAAGGYPTVASPAANGGTTAEPAVFHVNGSLPKPGAPFADPCGVSKAAQPSPLGGNDPLFRPQDPYFADPALIGFRRYEASAVQLDMVTNRAGWHDPQARINVLSKDSARFKDNRTGDGLPVSPLVSGTEEPFFFRALSGECIEFRHTNELPKDLERDDFQVRTPTDTIGQHIHLVKFDVTSSDGSGNGWNYEDGTFAADEIAARICAYRRFLAEEDEGALGQRIKANRPAGELSVRMPDGFCESAITKSHSWWRQSLASARPHFQTTVQRWFADPILSPRYGPSLGTAENGQTSDRTLRTVFTHDHFGPSSIQQHGFYSALLIEPRSARVCEPTAPGGAPNAAECQPARKPGDFSLAQGTAGWTGARKIIDVDAKEIGSPRAIDPTHPDYREYALAIADFATLYDPRDHESEAAFRQAQDGSPRGLQALACEARHRNDPTELKSACGSAMEQDTSIAGSPWHGGEDIPPAWAAAGKPGGLKRGFTLPGILSEAEVTELIERSIEYRKRAAGNPQGDRLAKPVAPPQRPEAISVDHHDPYLVNYRGEPLPLRVGTKNSDGTVSGDCLLRPIDSFVEALREAAAIAGCSIGTQISLTAPLAPGQRPSGDMADVFLSAFHGDPVTPILEGYDGERIVMRLVQGAQEVQHTFNLEGYTFGRNIDQSFASGHRALETSRALMPGDEATLDINCQATQAAAEGRPSEYALWRKEGTGAFPANSPVRAFWERHETLLERCDNAEGVVTAQEVGISEHFEFSGQFRQASAGVEFVPRARSNVQATTDYLYHFGSKDALWNGAWGLARIFRDKAAPDLSRCDPSDSACNDKAGGRLLALADLDSAPTDEGTAARATRQILSCRADAPRVHAVIAALETARVWPGGFDGEAGTPYGRGLQDRNGLMFALLDPQRLFAPDKAEAALAYDPSDPTTPDAASSWQNIPLDTIAKLVRESYARPEPLVLRVNANDCVTLHVINGLTAYRSTGGLKDDRGDAPMPPITPLNVENAWSKVETVETGGAEADQRPESFITGARSDIRPSARLGLSIPLPSLDHTQSVPLPFGQNTTSTLAPARCNAGGAGCTMSLDAPPVFSSEWPPFERRGDSIERLTFYAGRSAMKTAIDSLPVDIAIALDDRLRAEGAIANGRTLTVDEVLPSSTPAPFCSTDEGVAVELLGRPFRLCLRDDATDTFTALPQELADGAQTLASAADTLIAAWNAEAKARLAGDDYVHWTPYAFGTLPIKSTGDIIAHGAHGLFGGLIVEPREAVLPEAERHTFPGGIVALKPRDGGRMWVADIRARDMENREHKIREFVLFYQDGLNLRDARTANRWTSNDGTSRLVADCMVCDDSYDLGDQGVNYRSDPFFDRLRGEEAAGQHPPEAQFNLNAFVFPPRFWLSGHKPHNMPVLRAEAGDEIVVRVIHPGGRARQRNFSLIGNDYDDLFSGFGFPHAALVAPGKGVRAALTRKAAEGCYLWHDGTTTLNAGGTWGLIDVVARGALKRDEVSSCKGVPADVAKPGK